MVYMKCSHVSLLQHFMLFTLKHLSSSFLMYKTSMVTYAVCLYSNINTVLYVVPCCSSHSIFQVNCSVVQVIYELLVTEWNSWLVLLYKSTFINRLSVRCMRHKQFCGWSLHWLALDPCCEPLPQWQTINRKIMSLKWWLNV